MLADSCSRGVSQADPADGLEGGGHQPGDGADKSQIGYLIRPEDREEIENFIAQFPALVSEYIPVAIIGEGSRSWR